ncbi:MAG: DUF4240 domain-containing protein [Gemmataceae bacterium]|nr:DUF4240 domain-containing protein [Gemmataceae bacterium]
MTEDQFWAIIEDCRRGGGDLFAFDERLVTHLVGCDYPTIVAFQDSLGDKTGFYPNSSFRSVLREAGHDYSSANSWHRYMGWLVAQGRRFYEAVIADPEVARTHLPESEEYQDRGECVNFAAGEAVQRKSGKEWDLSDLRGFCMMSRPDGECESAWRTQDVIGLAQAADTAPLPDGRLDPARLAVLSDALEEAGCTSADILGHLRDDGPHLRGCWALELILGKE